MKQASSFAILVFCVVFFLGIALAFASYKSIPDTDYALATALITGSIFFILGLLMHCSIQIANEWERAVILRFGKFYNMKGPGLFFIIPLVDSIPYLIDLRVSTTPFKAEKTLTKDTVPVDVDAVLFWKVIDPKKSALEVSDYKNAISWASQTALRDVIGRSQLSEMLEDREKLDNELGKLIEHKASPWGIHVLSVEIRDVLIPTGLQAAMSMQAQAERERQARVILGDSERQIADSFQQASKAYENNPTALHLRAMNMLFEGLKEKGSLVIVPSSAVDTMNLGGLAGLTSLAKQRELEQNTEQE